MAKTQQSTNVNAGDMTLLNGAYEADGQAIGPIYLQDCAVVALVKKIVLSIDGVSRLAGSNFLDSLGELVGSKKIQDRAISITRKGKKVLNVNIAINVFFGVRIPALVNQITEAVTEAMQSMTGIHFSEINVEIRDMEERSEEIPEEENPDNSN